MQAIGVQKSRKPKFDLTFRLLDLNNIPYISGNICVKWHISGAGSHDDRTTRTIIKDHKALFEYERTTSLRLSIDKNNWLQEAPLSLEVIHEVKVNGKDERSLLGVVRVNLAEYVEASRMTEDPITRRYLLHESKINSTIKVSIRLVQTDGERSFMAPQLRSAPQFVGIAGVMAAEHMAEDDAGPTIALDPNAKEAGDELRELYKRTLAAELSCRPGDPSVEQVIEDIFAGGDGWTAVGGMHGAHALLDASDTNSSRRGGGAAAGGGGAGTTTDEAGMWSDGEHQQQQRGQNQLSPSQQQARRSRAQRPTGSKHSWPDFQTMRRLLAEQRNREEEEARKGAGGGPYRNLKAKRSFGQASHRTDLTDREYVVQMPDVDELEVREDLKCWLSRPMQ